jgi:soluble cytochrome b562
MEKMIFLGLAIPILAFVLYLGGTAIMSGFKAKSENKSNEKINDNQDQEQNFSEQDNKLTDELDKLNQLLNDGVLTEEEFKKAKKKILDD